MPKPIKYHGGSYKRTPAGTFRGCVYNAYREHKKVFATEAAVRAWIDAITHEIQDNATPLTAFEMDDARNARNLLPEGISLTAAADFYRRNNETLATGLLLDEAITQFLAEKERGGLRQKTVQGLRAHLNRLSRGHSGSVLRDLSGPVLIQWLDTIGVAGVTRNNYRRSLGNFFRWCVRVNYLAKDPTLAITTAKTDQQLPTLLTVQQTRALLRTTRVLDSPLLPYQTLACFAGIRPTELARLHQDDIDIKNGYIHVTSAASKTRQQRYVAILPVLRKWLDAYPITGPIAPPNLRKRLTKVRRGAGLLPWPADVMRHSFATYHLAHFQEPGKTALELGHSRSLDMLYNNYRSLATPAQAEDYFASTPDQLAELSE